VIRNNVSFRYPAPFVFLSNDDGILAANGAKWFVDMLKRVPHLDVNEELCQEDWGVVVFVKRNKRRFWVGLGLGMDMEENTWLAHIHHSDFAWIQRISSRGRNDFKQLITDIHAMLVNESGVSEICWYKETDMDQPYPSSSPTPDEP
jgi:hypothetical protein